MLSIIKSNYATATSYTVAHGLTQRPKLVINKNIDLGDASYGPWWTWVEGVTGTDGDYMALSSNIGKFAFSGTFTTSTTIQYHTSFQVNGSNKNIISYCFHDVENYQKIGSYQGTGASGNAQNIGFQPRLVLLKRTDGTSGWYLMDSVRGEDKQLYPEFSGSEGILDMINITSTGFNFSGSTMNISSAYYLYLAIA